MHIKKRRDGLHVTRTNWSWNWPIYSLALSKAVESYFSAMESMHKFAQNRNDLSAIRMKLGRKR
jgi:hypothetical protein